VRVRRPVRGPVGGPPLVLNAWFASALAAAALALFAALTHDALTGFSRARLEEALRRRGREDELLTLFKYHDELIRTTGLLHVLGLVALTVLALAWSADRFGASAGGLAVGAAAAAIAALTLGAAVPMAWARCAAESVLVAALPACHVCRTVLAPLVRGLGVLDALVRRLAGVPSGRRPASPIDEEILSVVAEGEREGALGRSQKDMIEGVIRFRQTDASQILTPRTDIVSIDAGASTDEARALVASSGHSRIPVTRGHLDTIVGILYAKDLLERSCGPGAEQLRVKDVMRAPLFVPETKKLDELLQEFQGDKVHMAIVLDEYGGTAGLVTIEDVVEEIVGEIVDEYEQAPPKPIRGVGDRAFEVEARVRIDELNRELALGLPQHEDYETIGGFVLSRLGYIPKAGETLEHDGVRITVLEAEERRILRVRIDLPAQAGTPREP
jgi:CBS domain containing-hemolysin-like protein